MKKPVLKIIALLVVAAAAWFSYAAWRASRNLVTLNVKNMDVRDVVRKIERQTWETIFVQKQVEGKVTFNVRKLPLDDVLNIIAEQTSVRWTALYPLYTSDKSLANFKRAVLGEIPAAENGWTNLQGRSFMGRGGMFGDMPRNQASLISVQIQNKELDVATMALARYAQAQVVPEDGTAGMVSLTLNSVTMPQAVEKLAKQMHRNWAQYYALRTSRGGGRDGGRDGGDFARRGGPRGEGGPPDDGGGPPRERGFRDGPPGEGGTNRFEPTPEMRAEMERQMQAQLETMPPEERKRVEEQRTFFQGMRDLPPEQRQQKMAEFMNNPERLAQMQARMMSGIKNTTPEQRAQRDRERAMRGGDRGGPGGRGGPPGGGR